MTRNKKANAAHMSKIAMAVEQEQIALNEAIRKGAEVKLHTFNGDYRVKYVSPDFWYHTEGNGGYGQSWCGCNDGTWAGLLKQAGVQRALPEWER